MKINHNKTESIKIEKILKITWTRKYENVKQDYPVKNAL